MVVARHTRCPRHIWSGTVSLSRYLPPAPCHHQADPLSLHLQSSHSHYCTECKGSCCDLSVTRKLNGTLIETKIKMKPRCADCKGSCCDFFSTMRQRVPHHGIGGIPPIRLPLPEPVQVQMQPRCMDCTRIECCDWGRSENAKQTSMISYLWTSKP